MSRFERIDASTLTFPGNDPKISVTVLAPRIVRVALAQTDPATTPSYVADREWPPAPFEVVEGNPVRVVTADLHVEVTTEPLRIALLDAEALLHEGAGDHTQSDIGRGVKRMAITFHLGAAVAHRLLRAAARGTSDKRRRGEDETDSNQRLHACFSLGISSRR